MLTLKPRWTAHAREVDRALSNAKPTDITVIIRATIRFVIARPKRKQRQRLMTALTAFASKLFHSRFSVQTNWTPCTDVAATYWTKRWTLPARAPSLSFQNSLPKFM